MKLWTTCPHSRWRFLPFHISGASHGIDAHGSFQGGERQVIDDECSSGVSGNGGCPGFPFCQVILHRYDVFHLDGLRTCQAEFLPQVVGMVPEHGAPGDAKGSVQSLECCADGFSREAVSQPEGLGLG